MDDVYWRILLTNDDIHIVCMQWFDETDYDQNKFLSKEKFESEEKATEFVREISESGRSFPDKVKNALNDFLGDDVKHIFD